MTSRARRDDVAGIYSCKRCNIHEGNADGERD